MGIQHKSREGGGFLIADGGHQRDEEAVIAVDWEAVELELEMEIPEDLRHSIEREGNALESTLDKYGYRDMASVKLHSTVKEHSCIVHPDRGPIRSVPVHSLGHITSAIKSVAYGRDLNIAEPSEEVDGDETSYLDGLGTLIDAADALDGQRDDWYMSPRVAMGSYGPDQLGSLYIHLKYTSRAAIESLETVGLDVELERITHWEDRPHNDDFQEHYEAVYRHERYYAEEERPEYGEYAEKAEEVGLFSSNLGTRRSVTVVFEQRGLEYEQIDELAVLGAQVRIYQYEKDGDDRWAVEWSERVKIDEVVWYSLLFNERPGEEEITQAGLIEEARLGGKDET